MSRIGKTARIVSWVLQIIAAVILGQTLFFKFAGAEETKALFEVLGAEPAGRYATAVMELMAVVLLLVPRTAVIGAIVSIGVISGAIMAHLTKLGVSINPQELGNPSLEALEGPSLFVMAVIVLLSSMTVVVIRRSQIPVIGKKFA
jgi:uncharacterized membrane protein YphA (DoxX/SURF4 family)